MSVASVGHWLVAHGIYQDLVNWSVGFIMGSVLLVWVRRGIRRLSDLLDTTTPGGLTDLVEAVERSEADARRDKRP